MSTSMIPFGGTCWSLYFSSQSAPCECIFKRFMYEASRFKSTGTFPPFPVLLKKTNAAEYNLPCGKHVEEGKQRESNQSKWMHIYFSSITPLLFLHLEKHLCRKQLYPLLSMFLLSSFMMIQGTLKKLISSFFSSLAFAALVLDRINVSLECVSSATWLHALAEK